MPANTSTMNNINTILDELNLQLKNYFNNEIKEKCIPYEIIKTIKSNHNKFDSFLYDTLNNQLSQKNKRLLKDILTYLFNNNYVYIGSTNNYHIKIDSLFFPELEHILDTIFSILTIPYIVMIKKYKNGYIVSILERFY